MKKKHFFLQYLQYFDNPQLTHKYIHIAGTKGKTSVCYYVYQMLQEYKVSVGLFTSPHIFSENERIQRNGAYISTEQIKYYRKLIEKAKMELSLPIHFFEEITLICFLFFKDFPVDYIVLEVGIGGKYDTTNIVIPELSVITRIQKDHKEILGKTLLSMFIQKFGIIKPGINFIIGKQNFLGFIYSKILSWRRRKFNIKLPKVRVIQIKQNSIEILLNNTHYTLQGPLYMLENFVIASSIINILGYTVPSSFTHCVPGRMQYIGNDTFLDGAHNPIAVKKLVHTIQKQFPKEKWNIILCIRSDKDFKKAIKYFIKLRPYFIILNWGKIINESYDPKHIIKVLQENGCDYIYTQDLNIITFKYDNTLVTGSFYHLGPVYNMLMGK